MDVNEEKPETPERIETSADRLDAFGGFGLFFVDEKKPETPERIETIADRLAFKSRFVMLFGEINHAVARATCTRLIALAEESEGPVTALISAPGGHVESGDAIHDIIRFVRAPVTTVGTGW